VPSDTVAALRQLRARQLAAYSFAQRDGFVAVDEHGQPLRPERWSDMWAQLCQAAGVRPLTLHAARHTSVTAMRNRGVPDHDVARWHGHDEVVMRRTYSHADEDGLRAAGEALHDQNVTAQRR
jgi:integrase